MQRVPVDDALPVFCIHLRSIVIDGRISIIGSHNLDPRSIAINTDASLMVRDERFAAKPSRSIRRAIEPQNSWAIARRQDVPLIGRISGMIGNVSRLRPVLDLWPFRYTVSFEPIPGKPPVARADPRVYQHSLDAGQFPQVGLACADLHRQ